jgi:hypothetical protein
MKSALVLVIVIFTVAWASITLWLGMKLYTVSNSYFDGEASLIALLSWVLAFLVALLFRPKFRFTTKRS